MRIVYSVKERERERGNSVSPTDLTTHHFRSRDNRKSRKPIASNCIIRVVIPLITLDAIMSEIALSEISLTVIQDRLIVVDRSEVKVAKYLRPESTLLP